jgi:hypothetical protein
VNYKPGELSSIAIKSMPERQKPGFMALTEKYLAAREAVSAHKECRECQFTGELCGKADELISYMDHVALEWEDSGTYFAKSEAKG